MKRLMSVVLLSVTATVWAQDTLPVGVITSITGRFAEFGEQHQAGFQVALEEINAGGGVGGQQLELVLRDDTSDVNAALSAAESLAREVPIVLGAYSSSITNPLAQYFARQEFPFLVFTSSEDAITAPGSEYTFRLNQPASAYATVLFDIFDELNSAQDAGLETVALIHGNGPFESSVADAAVRLAEERGFEITERESYDRGVTDFRPILNRFATAAPDVVFMVSYAEDSVGLLRQSSEVGLNPRLFAGGAAGFALPNFIEGAGAAANFVVTATTWTQDAPYEGAQDLYERLTEALGGTNPSYHAAQAYAGLIDRRRRPRARRRHHARSGARGARRHRHRRDRLRLHQVRGLRRLSESKPADDARAAGTGRCVRHGVSGRRGDRRADLPDTRLERTLNGTGSPSQGLPTRRYGTLLRLFYKISSVGS